MAGLPRPRWGCAASSAPAPRLTAAAPAARARASAAAAARLRRQPGVAYAEPNYIAHAAGAFYPDDPGRAKSRRAGRRLQWNLLPAAGVNAPEAWANLIADHRPGGRGVVGGGPRHRRRLPRLAAVPPSPDFTGTRSCTPTTSWPSNRYPLDRNGHGTFVAGVVAEATNNKVALTGIAYGASIMPVRVLDAQRRSATRRRSPAASATRSTHGAQVINLSLEFLPTRSRRGRTSRRSSARSTSRTRAGVTVVGAAGNDQSDQIAYPARVANVISVGATTRDRCLADYSNGGTGLDLVAPGGGDDAIMPADPTATPTVACPRSTS